MQPPKFSGQVGTWVKYITAPPPEKLPVYCQPFWRQPFCIAFDNNKENNYRFWSPFSLKSTIPGIAHKQGADFMFQCVQTFLDSLSLGPHRIECDLNQPDFQTTEDALQKYVDERFGDQHQCLFHLDAHCKMCPRMSDHDTGKDFSQGAIELLAGICRA